MVLAVVICDRSAVSSQSLRCIMNNLRLAILVFFFCGGLWAQDGVQLYTKKHFKGRAERITANDPDLDDNFGRKERLRSLRIPANCSVTLYEHKGYRGREICLRGDVGDLDHTGFGRENAMSLRIEWERPGPQLPRPRSRDGVFLFVDVGFRGTTEAIFEDIADLGATGIGNDRLSSLKLSPGVEVILYEHVGYRGKQERLVYDDGNLRDNYVGNDCVSSLRIVRHEAESHDREPSRDVIMLYEHPGFRGSELAVRSDIRDLRGTQLGNDRLSSIRIPQGYVVTIYADIDFQGPSETLLADDRDLADNWIGDDRVSSIKFLWAGNQEKSPRRRPQ